MRYISNLIRLPNGLHSDNLQVGIEYINTLISMLNVFPENPDFVFPPKPEALHNFGKVLENKLKELEAEKDRTLPPQNIINSLRKYIRGGFLIPLPPSTTMSNMYPELSEGYFMVLNNCFYFIRKSLPKKSRIYSYAKLFLRKDKNNVKIVSKDIIINSNINRENVLIRKYGLSLYLHKSPPSYYERTAFAPTTFFSIRKTARSYIYSNSSLLKETTSRLSPLVEQTNYLAKLWNEIKPSLDSGFYDNYILFILKSWQGNMERVYKTLRDFYPDITEDKYKPYLLRMNILSSSLWNDEDE